MSKRAFLAVSLTFAFALVATIPADYAYAGVYEGNKCVSSKIKEAGKLCQGYLKAHAKWDKDQDTAKRDTAIGKAESKFLAKWTKADTKAAGKGVDCADTTMDGPTAEGLVETGVDAVVAAINAGLTLTPAGSDDGKCGAKLLKEASKKCSALLKNYSKFIKNPGKDPKRVKLNEKVGKVIAKFEAKFDAGLVDCPNSTATTAGVEALVDAIRDDIKTGTTVSPNVSDTTFDTHTHPGPGQPGHEVEYEGDTLIPRCQDFSDYSFFVKRGTENKLLMYYQGGGVCWSGATCCLNTCDQDVNVAGSDNPNNGFNTGFGDITNPANPFRDWNIVFVSYCSCDIHTGDNGQSYGGALCGGGGAQKAVEHRGFHNAKLAEKFAREHFLDPEVVFVTGSSAGAFGSLTHVTPLARIYSHSEVSQLADAGTFEPTQGFADTVFDRWGTTNNFQSLAVPGIDLALIKSTGFLEGAIEAITTEFPDVRMSQYVTAHDGSTGGLGGFHHVMVNHPYPGEPAVGTVTGTWPRWWDSTCSYNAIAEAQMAAIEAATSTQNDNYRYYLASGSRHTMFGSNKVYDSSLGGVETIVDYINKEIARDPNDPWTTQIASPRNVLAKECKGGTNNGETCPTGLTDCPDQGGPTCAGGTNAGEPCPGGIGDCPDQTPFVTFCDVRRCEDDDPNPNPLECPFKTVGSDIVIDCVSCP